jgi:hypothetical protein
MRLEIEYERGHGTMGPLFRGIEDIGSIEQVDVDDGGADVTQPGPRRLTIMLLVDHSAALDALRPIHA